MEAIPLVHNPTSIVKKILAMEVYITGGYPLWLSGYAPFYSDVDIVCSSWTEYYKCCSLFNDYPIYVGENQVKYLHQNIEYQIISPLYYYDNNPEKYLGYVDFSAGGILLTQKLTLETIYKNDIINKKCRVFYKDPIWYNYRANTFIKKGFELYE